MLIVTEWRGLTRTRAFISALYFLYGQKHVVSIDFSFDAQDNELQGDVPEQSCCAMRHLVEPLEDVWPLK